MGDNESSGLSAAVQTRGVRLGCRVNVQNLRPLIALGPAVYLLAPSKHNCATIPQIQRPTGSWFRPG